VATLFAVLTAENTAKECRSIAVKGALIGSAILLFFAFFGERALGLFGISLAALRTAGGILLFLITIDMVFAHQSGSTTTTGEENKEAENKNDIAVFPLATPLIAGPGAIGAAILLMANQEGDPTGSVVVVGAMLSVILLAFVLMLLAGQAQKVLGVTSLRVISRVVGVILAALAVQFVFNGIKASRLLT